MKADPEAREIPAPPASVRDSARLPEDQAQEIVERTARRVVELLQAGTAAASTATRYADSLDNPLGSARAFADAARRGDFPTFRKSRRVTALWTDVETWIQSRPAKRRGPGDAIDPALLLASALGSRKARSTRAA
jgi:hypothetical protein